MSKQKENYKNAMKAFRKALLLNPKAVIEACNENIEKIEKKNQLDIISYNLGFAAGFADAFHIVGVKNGKLPTKQ